MAKTDLPLGLAHLPVIQQAHHHYAANDIAQSRQWQPMEFHNRGWGETKNGPQLAAVETRLTPSWQPKAAKANLRYRLGEHFLTLFGVFFFFPWRARQGEF
jgi:hypothetical protein